MGSGKTSPHGDHGRPDYVIFGEVSYKYVPAVGYVMARAGVPLSDTTYTRPRQSTCVTYGVVQNC